MERRWKDEEEQEEAKARSEKRNEMKPKMKCLACDFWLDWRLDS